MFVFCLSGDRFEPPGEDAKSGRESERIIVGRESERMIVAIRISGSRLNPG